MFQALGRNCKRVPLARLYARKSGASSTSDNINYQAHHDEFYLTEPKVNDHRQIGDYPDLPAISDQLRDPHGYWDQQTRRNFNEPVSTILFFCLFLFILHNIHLNTANVEMQENAEVLSIWFVDEETKFTLKEKLTGFSVFVGGFVLFCYLTRKWDKRTPEDLRGAVRNTH